MVCGICGKLFFDPATRVEPALLRRMCAVIRHRGPDESNVYVDQSVGLGHTRLSIIDLSTGQQPMSNARRDIWVAYNGEIYNFPALRKNLAQRGYIFQSHSDTEVLIHLYDEYGTACVNYLRGMFAFAIWDTRRQRLFLARDRTGQKPLFYTITDQAVLFASEIKAILQDPTVPRTLNLTAMHHYLTYGYVPTPETMFQKIYKLPPAHIWMYQQGTIAQERYWHLAYTPKIQMKTQEREARLRELLLESVRLRMISDVPIGAFLSGGIDSSLVVALMAQCSSAPVKTFSIGFEEAGYNELPYARLVAERFGTEHHEFIVKPDAVEILPKLVWLFDEPFGDSSAIPTYYLAQMTRQHVKVALNGDGGDESFAGYLRYVGYIVVRYYRAIPQPIRKHLLAPLIQLLHDIGNRPAVPLGIHILCRRLKILSDLAFDPHRDHYVDNLVIFRNQAKFDIFSEDVRKQLADINSLNYMFQYFDADNVEHLTDKMLYSDVMTYLPDDLLVKVDRATMAHGLEGRSPFLDHKLMEFAATLPPDDKLRGTRLKYMLKKIGKPWLPEQILTRAKKGFSVPIGLWFRRELKEMVHDVFTSSCLIQDGIFNPIALRRMFDEHQSGKINHQHRIWLFVNLELWYRMFIRNG